MPDTYSPDATEQAFNASLPAEVTRTEPTSTLVSGGPLLETISVWRASAGWVITREGADVDVKSTRAGAENAALRLLGIDPKTPSIIRTTEY